MSRELPILFSAPMIRALLANHKTQTRRVVHRPAAAGEYSFGEAMQFAAEHGLSGVQKMGPCDGIECVCKCPWKPGDRLWVRETWSLVPATAYRQSVGVQQTVCPHDRDMAAVYRAGWDRCRPGRWRPSIHMPRWASRITLEVVAVRAERLQAITPEDCRAEGSYWATDPDDEGGFINLWDSLNAASGHGWDRNEWVWVVTFRRVAP